MKPLLKLAENPKKPTIVPADTVLKIFRNIDMILKFNEKLLNSLATSDAVENKVRQYVSATICSHCVCIYFE